MVTTEVIHLIVRLAQGSSYAYATSPQAPGLLYGQPSLDDLYANLNEVLEFHFDRPGPFEIIEHQECLFEVAGAELVVRIASDSHREERHEVFERIGRALRVPSQAASLLAAPANRVGEVVYVCAVASDTVGWLVGQLDPCGDIVTIVTAISDDLLFAKPLANAAHAEIEGDAVEPHPVETTLAEIIRETPIVQPSQPHRILAAG